MKEKAVKPGRLVLVKNKMAAMDESNSQPSSDSEIYGSLRNFTIEKKIGRGQFSVVYKAKCLVDNSIIALKKVQVSSYRIKKS